MTRVAHKLALVVSLCALGMPAVTHASPRKVIRDCAWDGVLDREYSNEDLRKAENMLPSDQDEYSDCREVIAAAVTGGSDLGRGREDSHGGGAIRGGRTDDEQANRIGDIAAADKLTHERKRPNLTVGGRSVEPEDDGLFSVPPATNGLPLPLLLALTAALLFAGGGGAVALRRRSASAKP